jgi:hypothetical protein
MCRFMKFRRRRLVEIIWENKVSQSPFTLLDRLADSDSPRLVLPAEARMLFNELEMSGDYQILAWRRDADHCEQIEMVISFPKKRG